MSSLVLVVDDDDDTATLISGALRRRGVNARDVNSAEAALEELGVASYDVIVTDVHMPYMSGIELCEHIHRARLDSLVIVVTAKSDLETAVAAMRAGAFDFVTKPVKIEVLSIAVQRAREHLALKRELSRLRDETRTQPWDEIGGKSPAIREVIDMVSRIAASDATVLIHGESGTGKELIARALHSQSGRKGLFVAVNCAAMPPPLLESELFGHVRGAFTDARGARAGLLVKAHGGTLFLDEIGEMPLEVQVKLLRVLQERTVRPVGSDTEIPVETRIVTATNRLLEHEVEHKRFRADLYYRINVVSIWAPPLRSRQGDVLMLAQRFLQRIASRMGKPVRSISNGAARRMLDYDWPGNVRELENCMERAVALCSLDEITLEDLPRAVVEPMAGQRAQAILPIESLVSIDEMARRYISEVMVQTGGNKTEAAKILGVDRRTLHRQLQRLTSQTYSAESEGDTE